MVVYYLKQGCDRRKPARTGKGVCKMRKLTTQELKIVVRNACRLHFGFCPQHNEIELLEKDGDGAYIRFACNYHTYEFHVIGYKTQTYTQQRIIAGMGDLDRIDDESIDEGEYAISDHIFKDAMRA